MLVKVVVEFLMVMNDFLEDSLDNDLDREVEFVDILFLISIMLQLNLMLFFGEIVFIFGLEDFDFKIILIIKIMWKEFQFMDRINKGWNFSSFFNIKYFWV